MKTIASLLLCQFLSLALFSQHPYYDAMALTADTVQGKVIVGHDSANLSILARYFSLSVQADSVQADSIKAVFEKNPFFTMPGEERSTGKDALFSPLDLIPRAAPTSMNVTAFADGLAQFLIERAKEELNVAFFQRLKDFFYKYPEIKILFPQAFRRIDALDIQNYNAFLPDLQKAFRDDLKNISDHIPDLSDWRNFDGYRTDARIRKRADNIARLLNTEAGRAATAGLIILKGFHEKKDLAGIVHQLCASNVLKPGENLTSAFDLFDLVVSSLRGKGGDKPWISLASVNALIADEMRLKIYLGLLYAQDQLKNPRKVLFTVKNNKTLKTDSISFKKFMETMAARWETSGSQFSRSLRDLSEVLNKTDSLRKEVNKLHARAKDTVVAVYDEYLETVSRTFSTTGDLLTDNLQDAVIAHNVDQQLIEINHVVESAAMLEYGLQVKDYQVMAIHSLTLLEKILDEHFPLGQLTHYLNFMASLSRAATAEEYKAALNAAVLPVGSSSIKKNNSRNISINAYIGPAFGNEYLPALKTNQVAPVIGVTAPVGVAFSWGNIGNGKRNGALRKRKNGVACGGKSITFFVPLIDVGAMASFRLGNPDASVAPNTTLANIISPGAFAYFGFGKYPISFGFGIQGGRQNRLIEIEKLDNASSNYYLRYGVSLVVDIPFFNLYTKQ